MSAKHTPGPWLLAKSDPTFVYSLNRYDVNAFQAHFQGPCGRTELEANARLEKALERVFGGVA